MEDNISINTISDFDSNKEMMAEWNKALYDLFLLEKI